MRPQILLHFFKWMQELEKSLSKLWLWRAALRPLCRRMSSPPMKSPWRCVQKGQTADGKIWIKHIRKDFHFSGKNHSTPFNADEMTTGNRDCTVCSVSSASVSLAQVTSCLTSFCFAALGALVPNLDPRVWTIVITFLQTPSVSNETPCQTKVSTEYRPTGQTDYYTLQTFELLPCYLSASQKQPQKSPG